MSPTPDLQDVIHDVVLAVLALATGYHLVRLVRGPVRAVDAAHALMGAVMLLMMAGRLGHAAGLSLAAVFVAVGIAGVFARSRGELAIGCAAMIVMLAATPLTAAAAAVASSGKAVTTGTTTPLAAAAMPGMAGMGHSLQVASTAGSSSGSSAGLVTLILVVVLVPALMVVAAGALLRSRTCTTEPPGDGASPAAVACRVGLNLASAYMLVLMV